MDCFQKLMEISVEDYCQWLAHIPEGTAHHKLAGLLKWGEIEINQSHASDLVPVLEDSLARMDAAEMGWVGTLIQCLQMMIEEPALYLMVRKAA
jgi:hypothetical protein